MPKIIVLTPVKNEEHFIHRFLSVTSNFADHIIIADQNSTDKSRDIILNYSKTILINNADSEISNAKRQTLLINEARKRFGTGNLLLALDVDEILSSNVLDSHEWKDAQTSTPGTVLYFEKPDLYLGTHQCIRYSNPWPLGFVDDGSEHFPKQEHSIRIPTPKNHKRFVFSEVKVLHYALTRLCAQFSKVRLYSVRENISGNWNVLQRRRVYSQTRDYTEGGELKPTKTEWFHNWESLGIDVHSVCRKKLYWYDKEVLKKLLNLGEKRFYWDDIWNVDWEEIKQVMIKNGDLNNNHRKIKKPGVVFRIATILIDKFDYFLLGLKRLL